MSGGYGGRDEYGNFEFDVVICPGNGSVTRAKRSTVGTISSEGGEGEGSETFARKEKTKKVRQYKIDQNEREERGRRETRCIYIYIFALVG